jgi:hypothetical protein
MFEREQRRQTDEGSDKRVRASKSVTVPRRVRPASARSATPVDHAPPPHDRADFGGPRIEATTRIRPAAANRTLIRRHTLRPAMPASLDTPVVDGVKQRWKAEDYFDQRARRALVAYLRRTMPPRAVPGPQKRVDDLVFKDHWTAHADPDFDSAKATAAAYADSNTGVVHVNNSLSDYFRRNGSVDRDKVTSTLVHEAMHAVSASHKGLQNFGDFVGDILNSPDEAVTDYLAVAAHSEIFGPPDASTYKTGYFPPSAKFLSSAGVSEDLRAKAAGGKLPSTWTGDMVAVLMRVLAIDEQTLLSAYFTNPLALDAQMRAKQEELRDEWTAKKASEVRARFPGFETEDDIAAQAGAEIRARKAYFAAQPRDAARDEVKAALRAPVAPADEPIITKRLEQILGAAAAAAAPAVPGAGAPVPLVAAPAVPGAGAPGPPLGGPPPPAARRRAPAAAAPVDMAAALAAGRGRLNAPAADPVSNVAATAKDTLGLGHRTVRIVRVPPAPALDATFATYGNDNVAGLSPGDLNRLTMRNLLHIPTPALKTDGTPYAPEPTAQVYIQDHYGDGGYERSEQLVVVTSTATKKAVVHEVGHFHQHVEAGLTEAEVPGILLEYHNIVLNENRAVPNDRPGDLRKQYDRRFVMRPRPSAARWGELSRDVATMPLAARHALAEVETALKVRQKYSEADELQIRSNLLQEFFAPSHQVERDRIKNSFRGSSAGAWVDTRRAAMAGRL